ncbi:MAG: amino acid permease [Sporolactobacillus sp.]
MKKFDHPILARVRQSAATVNKQGEKKETLSWQQLALIGISSVIGAGFFLGSSVAIQSAGRAVLLSYFVSGLAAFTVFSALVEMTVNDPQIGSFRTYAKQAFGDSYAFVTGWIYWLAGLLIVSSEITALATFSRFWFPDVPLWLFCFFFAACGSGIVLSGLHNFGTIESFFAVIKTGALAAFILFAFAYVLQGGRMPHAALYTLWSGSSSLHGFSGWYQSLIFTLLSFGGIEIVGITASSCRTENDVLKAGFSMIFVLTSLYLLAMTAVFMMVKQTLIHADQSPFVTALASIHLPFIDSFFNIIILSAAFSTMIGALYSMTTILAVLADDGAAPHFFRQQSTQRLRCLAVTFILLVALISVSYFLPKTVYEYLAAAAGTMLLLNWLNILLSDLKIRRTYQGAHWRFRYQRLAAGIGAGTILFSLTGALTDRHQRVSVVLSALILGILALSRFIKRRERR